MLVLVISEYTLAFLYELSGSFRILICRESFVILSQVVSLVWLKRTPRGDVLLTIARVKHYLTISGTEPTIAKRFSAIALYVMSKLVALAGLVVGVE